jgi:hypothetical protein
MSRHFIYALVLSAGITACSERPPIDWMYAEYKSLYSACPEAGKGIERKTSTASLTYTLSCPYPEDFNQWLSEFERSHLIPRGWAKGETKSPNPWKTYCNSSKKVVMRIVKVEAKKTGEGDRLWISLRFPGDECSRISEQAKWVSDGS